jgi:transcriptional regulator with XRE-family HTH domain
MSTADWSGVSRRIRARRTELGLSQQEAASRAGISVRVAAKYETEIPPSGPELATLEKLARALDVSPAWLLYGVGEHVAEIGEAMLTQLRGLGVLPTEDEVAWVTSAPNFLHMDALGVAQAILGQRRGIAPETAAIIEAETKRHDDPSVPRRKR